MTALRTAVSIVPVLFSAMLPAARARAGGAGEVAPDRNPVTLGHAVTLRWYFKGNRIVVSGGRFGKGVDVTGRTTLTDKPAKTTRYTFDVWYTVQPAPASASPKPTRQHVTYSTVVEVIDPRALNLTAYRDFRGWEVQHMKGWERDSVPLPDAANNALIFFQPDLDSVERLAVSVVPVTEASVASFMQKVQADLPSHYDKVEVLSEVDLTYENVPAKWMVFAGNDTSHPGTRTRSMVLVFVREGLGYVISGRTLAAKFEARQGLLRAMVKSFLFTQPPRASAVNPKLAIAG